MARSDVIYLIGEEPDANGVYERPKTTERMVYVTVRSVGMQETYLAMAHDRNPEVVFELAMEEEYQGEKTCRWNGKIYDVIRSATHGEKLRLTAERSRTK